MRESSEATSGADKSVEEIRISVYAVVADVLSESELQVIRRKLDEICEVQVKEMLKLLPDFEVACRYENDVLLKNRCYR